MKLSEGKRDYAEETIENLDIGALIKLLKPFLPIITKIIQDYPDEVSKTLTCLKPLLGKLFGEGIVELIGGFIGVGGVNEESTAASVDLK